MPLSMRHRQGFQGRRSWRIGGIRSVKWRVWWRRWWVEHWQWQWQWQRPKELGKCWDSAADALVERNGAVREYECLACDVEGKVTCLANRRYAWCVDGCVSVEDLGCDMVCEGQGRIRKEGQYCVR